MGKKWRGRGACWGRGKKRMVCVTLGGRGCVLATHDEAGAGRGIPIEVMDTVGAGDAFTAAMVTYWLRGVRLEGMAAAANRLGSYVASQLGAMPEFSANCGRS